MRRVALAVLFIVALVVAGCAAPAGPSQPATPVAQKTFKVGLLSPGSVNDEGWNSIAYHAMLRIRDELGAEMSYVELEQDPASFEKAFRDYASQGYDMILGHGFEFQDAALTVATEYPKTYFFISSSRVFEGNVIGLNTDSSQPYYLMGVAAATMAPEGAGFVGGMEIPPVSEALTGFTNGARSIDPDYPVASTYIGNFTDAAAAKEATLGMIAQGARMVVPDADVASLGVFQAVSESGPDVYTFGAFGDFTDKAPNNILGNYLANYGQGIVNIARQIKEGTFIPTANVEFGLANADVMSVEFSKANPLTPEAAAAVEAAKAAIVAGKVNALAE